MNLHSQLVKLHCYNIFLSLRITDAVWVVFLLSRGFTLAQIGIAEGIYHIVSFLFEVPSGMAADLLGRRNTLALSGAFGVLSSLFMAMSTDFAGVCLSMAFSALMNNFASGTQDAITYDSLLMAGKAGEYQKVSAWLNGIMRIVEAVGCVLGGFALWLGFFRAYLVSAAIGAAAAVSALALAEPVVTETQKRRSAHPFAGLLPRLKEHIRLSFSFLKEHPAARRKILAEAGIGVPIYLTVMYLQEYLPANGLPGAWLGAALLAVRLAGAAGVAAAPRLRLRLFPSVMACGICGGLGTVLAGVSGCWPLSVLGAALASFADGAAGLRLEVSLNDDFPSDQRATLISVVSMIYSMLMIAASPASGAVGDTLGLRWTFFLLGGALAACTAEAGLLYRRRAGKAGRRADALRR